VLGTEGLSDKRIFIDFRHDRITISRSRFKKADGGFIVIPVQISPANLLMVKAYVGSVPVKAIIDTGGQVSIANRALEEALARKRREEMHRVEIIGTTDDVQVGDGLPVPNISLGKLTIRGAHVTMGDMQIFEQWKLTSEPVLLIGMDTLGLLDTLIIDYRRRELQIQMHSW
jgi:hypothetical protein